MINISEELYSYISPISLPHDILEPSSQHQLGYFVQPVRMDCGSCFSFVYMAETPSPASHPSLATERNTTRRTDRVRLGKSPDFPSPSPMSPQSTISEDTTLKGPENKAEVGMAIDYILPSCL